ncbi:unnamed protein product [Laminaria digitata]
MVAKHSSPARPWKSTAASAVLCTYAAVALCCCHCSCLSTLAFQTSPCSTSTLKRGSLHLNSPPRTTISSRSPYSSIALQSSGTPEATPTSVGDIGRSNEERQEGNAPESGMWQWRNGWEVHFEHARREGAPPLLLLPGFGVGTFHFKRNMQELSKTHDVYALDFLGQGKSWPTRAPSREDGLCYSVDTWTEQVLAFIDEVIGRPAYVAGNSLGGFIGTNLAANHPRSVLGLALMNATPFWAFRKPTTKMGDVGTTKMDDFGAQTGRDSGATSSVGGGVPGDAAVGGSVTGEGGNPGEGGGDWLKWDGILPAPEGLFRFGAWYFDRMRDPRTVKSMLGAVYSNPGAIGEEVVSEIIAATDRGPSNHDYGVGGHEAFTSIVFAPKVSMKFEDMIDRLEMPLVLIYGKEDPWVVPLWGHRIKRQRPETLYYQVSPSGHSPHHETPNTVNSLLAGWLEYARNGGSPPLSKDGQVLQMAVRPKLTFFRLDPFGTHFCFFFHPIYYIFLFFSGPLPCRNSNPGSHSGHSSPLPATYGACLSVLSREELSIFMYSDQ